MVKWQHSIITKLTAGFVVLILIISGMSVMYTFGATKDALKETTREELIALASIIATQIDGDALALIRPGDEESASFAKIRDQLYAMEISNPEIRYLYTMRRVDEKVAFVVDAEYGISEDAASVDEVYATPPKEMLDGFQNSTADREFTTDQWGTVMSGYAPIKNSEGKVVGITGVDMSADRIIDRQDFIGNIIYLIMLIGIIGTGLIIGFFSKTMIRDIRILNTSAARISTGDMDVKVSVERNDEIGELSDSFSRMVSSLKIMMMDDKDDKDDKP